jgi:microcin C transport system permease protein
MGFFVKNRQSHNFLSGIGLVNLLYSSFLILVSILGANSINYHMRDYFIRRFLLIPPTLLGITLIVFFITRIVPGGPLERAIMEMSQVDAASGTSTGSGVGEGQALSEDQLQQLKEYYGFDKPWYLAYVDWMGKLVQGDLGKSTRYNDPVLGMINQALPVSIFYGLITLVLTYSVCIPLGIVKAIKHRTFVDNVSSILIFGGYAIPGYVLGALLLLFFSVSHDIFPMGGFVDQKFAYLMPWGVFSSWESFQSVVHHAILPLACYLIGSFAVTTLLMKNHLMDNLAADYMRTAVAKGVPFRVAVIKHAMRNSLIPIATTFGQNIVLFVGGSFLIEFLFDINGFGLLGLTAIFDRDYPVVMGVITMSSFLLLLGNIISDALVAVVDPRIRFK